MPRRRRRESGTDDTSEAACLIVQRENVMIRTWSRCLAVVLFGVMARAVTAGDPPARFTLGRYVPSDSWMFMQFANNPETAWLDERWARVWDALKNSGLDRDATSLIFSLFGDEDRLKVEAGLEKATTLLKGVHWSDLCAEEFAFAERAVPSQPMFDYMMVCRGKPGSAAQNIAGLAAVLQELAAQSPSIKLVKQEASGMDTWVFLLGGNNPRNELSMRLTLFRKGDTIGLVSGKSTGKQVLGMAAGQSDIRPISALPRFQEAVAQLPAPEDGVMFFDWQLLVKGVGQLIESHSRDDSSEGDKSVKPVFQKALRLFDFPDYMVITIETDGRQQRTHTLNRMQAGKEKSPVASVLLDRKPFTRFDQYIPAEATGFTIHGFIDLERAYQVITDFVRQEVPGGADMLTQGNAGLASVGFDPQRDIFSWWSGEMIKVQMPAVVVTPMSREDSVVMIRVKDPVVAAAKVNAAIDFLASFLKGQGQALMVQPAAVKAEGFREVTHPVVAMFLRPVVGVSGDFLMIGTSAGAINKCLAVAAGDAPSIMKNERFLAEGLIPKGPVFSASFTDTSRFGEELAEMTAAVGMVGGFMPMFAGAMSEKGGDADDKKAMDAVAKVFTMVTKLGPVFQKIDFYSSESSMSTRDGLGVRGTRVVTYKAAAAAPAKTAGVTPPAK